MANLLKETFECLEKNGKSMLDIEWIGGDTFTISKEDFMRLANVTYDNGYGGQEVPYDLVLVGKDFWLERKEYDGSEWWEMKMKPIKPSEEKPIVTLIRKDGCGVYRTLKEVQEECI